ncbi:MAG: CinA family protein [Patescibacteria group bacterium]
MKELLNLAGETVRKLRTKNLFITSVESCTGGGFANALTNITGASEVLMGAFICYSNEQKVALGVPDEVIDRFTVYSVETAIAMAEAGMRSAVHADIAVGITGSISRVDPANPNSQPGIVYIAVKNSDKTISQKFVFSDEGERWEVKERAITEAMKMVLEILKGGDHGKSQI